MAKLTHSVAAAEMQFEQCMSSAESRQSGVFIELDRVYSENSSSNQFKTGNVMKIGFEGVIRAGTIGAGAVISVSVIKDGILYYVYDYDLCSVIVRGGECPFTAPTIEGKSVRVSGLITEQIPVYLSEGEYSIRAALTTGTKQIACFVTKTNIIK